MHSERELLRELIEVSREQLAVQRNIYHDVHKILVLIQPKQLTAAIAVRFTGATAMQPNNTLVFNVGQTSTASLMPLLVDGLTSSGGTVSNVTYNFNDPSATVVINSDGLTAAVTGVADSGGSAVSGTATCTVTDTDGVVSQWTQSFTIQTNGGTPPPPQQLTQSVAVQFTDAVGAGKFPLHGSAPALHVGGTLVGQRSIPSK